LNPVSASGVFVGYSPHTKGWRVAIGDTVHVSPCVSFHEDMDGDCSVVPPEHSTDSNSEEQYDEDVATGLPLSPHATPAGPAPADQVPNVIADIEPAAANVDQTADAPPEIAAPRRSERVRAMPHRYEPGTAFVTEGDENRHIGSTQPSPSWVEGNAFAVGGEDAPKSYADIAKFGDLSAAWYDSYARELANMRDKQVYTAVSEHDVPSDAHIIDSKLDFRNKYGPNGAIVERKTRLCARGDQLYAGVDYGEVHTPMAAADCPPGHRADLPRRVAARFLPVCQGQATPSQSDVMR
jgi:hypothetical protein